MGAGKMKETIIFRPVEGTEHLTVQTLKVAKEIIKELGDRQDRVDYHKIAVATGLTRNGVSYAVDVLVRAEILDRENGKLSVRRKIVI